MKAFSYLLACTSCWIACSLATAAPPEGKGPGEGKGPPPGAGQGEKGAPGQGPQGQGMPPHPLLMIFDTDRDGAITSAEVEAVAKQLTTLDKNSDGKLTPDELPAPAGPPGGEGKGPPGGEGKGSPAGLEGKGPPGEGKGPPQGQGQGRGPKNGQGPPEGGMRPNPLMMVFDTDRDGAITSAEMEAGLTAMRTLDKNSDGKLTADELPRPGQGKNGAGPLQGQGKNGGGQFQQQQGPGQGKGPQQGQGPPGGKGPPPGGGPPNKN